MTDGARLLEGWAKASIALKKLPTEDNSNKHRHSIRFQTISEISTKASDGVSSPAEHKGTFGVCPNQNMYSAKHFHLIERLKS